MVPRSTLSRVWPHPGVFTNMITNLLSNPSNKPQRTFRKSVHSPLSTGPARRPSSSTKRIFRLSPSASRVDADGAWTKHVKCKSVSRLSGTAVWPDDAAAEWMSANNGVVSRIFARSSGVLSGIEKKKMSKALRSMTRIEPTHALIDELCERT
jgi:hypothetical protein